MKPPLLTFEEIDSQVNGVLNPALPYFDKIVKVYLFGSYAKNEAQEKSDVDIHVVSDGRMSLTELIDFQNRLKIALGKDVDALGSSTITEPVPLVKLIQKDEVLLYSKGNSD
jgi:predicted nucleotidyltransferase